VIGSRDLLQCEWYLDVEHGIPCICVRDVHISGVLYRVCLNLLHQACKLVLPLKSTRCVLDVKDKQFVVVSPILINVWDGSHAHQL
jgi:hypothetical protein